MKKKLLSLLLLLTILLCGLPITAEAATEYKCPNCGSSNFVVSKGRSEEATCTRDGYILGTCRDCDKTGTITPPALGHSWGSWKTTKEPTCTEKGTRQHTCKRCGITKTGSIDAKGHSYGSWTVVTEATCTEEGSKTAKCKVCGKKTTGTIQKLPHNWGEWEAVKEPTDFSMGTRGHTCADCGTQETEDFYPDGTLKNGDKGDAVTALQEKLNTEGYDCGTADGVYGKKTAAAVSALEAAHDMEGDGIAWPGVQDWLNGQKFRFGVRMPDPDSLLSLTVEVCYPEGYEYNNYTTTVVEGEPTNLEFVLDRTYDGVMIEWVISTGNGLLVYKPGMALESWMADKDGCVKIEGNTDNTFGIHFVYRGVELAEYRCPVGKVWKLANPEHGGSAYPFSYVETEAGTVYLNWYRADPEYVVDGNHTYYLREPPHSGRYHVEGNDIRAKEETTFYGHPEGYLQAMMLSAETPVYSIDPYTLIESSGDRDDLSSLKHPPQSLVDKYRETILAAGTEVEVIFSQKLYEYMSYFIRYEGEDGYELGWVTEGYIDPNAAPEPLSILDPNGGTVDPEFVASIDPEDFPTPVREHYKFFMWLPDQMDTDLNQRVFYAVWLPEYEFVVTFNWDGDWSNEGQLITNQGGLPFMRVDNYTKEYYMPIPEKEGYVFTGWSRTKLVDPETGVANGNTVPFTPGEPITGDMWLTPNFSPICTVTFDMGVFDPVEPMEIVAGTNYTLPVPQKDGYKFTGWTRTKLQSVGSKVASLSITPFKAGEPITADIWLRAEYEPTRYFLITFDAGEGNIITGTSSSKITLKTGPDGIVENWPDVEFAVKPLAFIGWVNEKGKYVKRDTVFTKNQTLEAVTLP